MIHANSILAWRTLDICERMRIVCGALEGIGRAATDREIRDAINSRHDMNYVRPRVTEALDASILEEVGSVVCPVTGKTVRLVWFAKPSLFNLPAMKEVGTPC